MGQHCNDQLSCGDRSALRRPIVPRWRIFISRPNLIAPANNHLRQRNIFEPVAALYKCAKMIFGAREHICMGDAYVHHTGTRLSRLTTIDFRAIMSFMSRDSTASYIIQYCGTGNNNIQHFVQLVNSVVVGIKSMVKRFSCEHSIWHNELILRSSYTPWI